MEVAAFAVGNAGMNSTGGLEAENRRFWRLVHSMRQEAERNQSLLHAFFAADLELLSCNTLEQLLAYLFTPFRERFGLDAVTLILLDPEETARDLLGEALRQNQLPNLRLVATQHLLRDIHPQQEIYRGEADGPLRAACFPDHPAVVSCAVSVHSETSYRGVPPGPTLVTIEEPVGGGSDGTVGATGCADVVGDRAAADGERSEPGRVLCRRGIVGQQPAELETQVRS